MQPNSTVVYTTIAHGEALEEDGIDQSFIILLFIVPFGLIGNVISLVTIFHSRLRKVSCFWISGKISRSGEGVTNYSIAK